MNSGISWFVKQEQQSNLILGRALKFMAKVLDMRADIFQPSCPLEVTTLHSWASRGEHVRGLLLLLITAVSQAHAALVRLKSTYVFYITEGYGQQLLAEGQSEQGTKWHLTHLCDYDRLVTGQLLFSTCYPVSGYCARFWGPYYKKLEQGQCRGRVMVWAGAEGLRELGWFSCRRGVFEGRTLKV